MAEEKLQAGLFSDQISISKSAKSTANDYGESTNVWVDDYLTVWAKIEYLSGSSEVKNDVEQRIRKIKVTVNYADVALLLAQDEDLFRIIISNITGAGVSTYYYITELKPIGFRNREFVEIYCKGRY
jgi:SPP1 family predicted phage head-tail adaptor